MEIVRQPIAIAESRRRRLQERLALRFPRITALLSRVVLSRPPSSRLRQMMIRRTFCLALESGNRGDYEAAFAAYPSDCEVISPPELAGLGFDPTYRGREGRLRFQEAWIGELGDFRNDPEELVDLGDRILVLGQMRGTGLSSGIAFDSEVAYLFTVSAGRIVREQTWRSHAEAFEAAGLSE